MERQNYLREWREWAKLSQEELAEAVGTTKSVISLLENEKRPLSDKWLRRLAEPLKTRPGFILDFLPEEAHEIEEWASADLPRRRQAMRILRSFDEPEERTGTKD